MKDDPRNKALDPRNPAHHHGLGLPAGYYQNPTPARKPTGGEAECLRSWREDFQRLKKAGADPRVFKSHPISAYEDYVLGRAPYPGLEEAREILKRAGE